MLKLLLSHYFTPVSLVSFLSLRIESPSILARLNDVHLIREATDSHSRSAQVRCESFSTTWRWALHGVRGVRLETYSVGVQRFTTQEAIERFVQATTAVANGEQPKPRTNRQRVAAITQAERSLDQAGM